MADYYDLVVDPDLIEPRLAGIDAHCQTMETCRKQLETIETRFAENQNMEGYTADEVKCNNLRFHKAAYGLYLLGDALITAVRLTAQRQIDHDESVKNEIEKAAGGTEG